MLTDPSSVSIATAKSADSTFEFLPGIPSVSCSSAATPFRAAELSRGGGAGAAPVAGVAELVVLSVATLVPSTPLAFTEFVIAFPLFTLLAASWRPHHVKLSSHFPRLQYPDYVRGQPRQG